MAQIPELAAKAGRHLARRDPVLKQLRMRVGACTLQLQADGFQVLVRAVLSQMISTKVALVMHGRLCAAVPGGEITPESLLAVSHDALRGVGLSGAKARALHDLAERAATGMLPLGQWNGMEDEEVINHLVQVRGVGRWTAEMFLIFSLGRPDVLPVGDLGLRAGVKDNYGLAELPSRAELEELAEPWRPYRSIATWYIWRSKGGVPQSR